MISVFRCPGTSSGAHLPKAAGMTVIYPNSREVTKGEPLQRLRRLQQLQTPGLSSFLESHTDAHAGCLLRNSPLASQAEFQSSPSSEAWNLKRLPGCRCLGLHPRQLAESALMPLSLAQARQAATSFTGGVSAGLRWCEIQPPPPPRQ